MEQSSDARQLQVGAITFHSQFRETRDGPPMSTPTDNDGHAFEHAGVSYRYLAVGGSPHEGADGGLTEAEREIVVGVLAGWSNRRIADERGVSVRTVANQLTSIYRKLGVGSRHELIRMASSRRG